MLPELKGKLDGSSIRVPTPNVSRGRPRRSRPAAPSLWKRSTPPCCAAADGRHVKGVLGYTDEPLVSSDFNHIANSSTVALPQTQVIDGKPWCGC